MRNSLKIVFVIIGTMIGAGFASGQEMYLFFFSYGIEGLIGIVVASVIMGWVINQTLKMAKKYEITTYKEFLDKLIPKSKKIKVIINFIINSFILITFFIMIAGFGAYFEQELAINRFIGSTLLVIVTYIIFMTSVKGVVKANELLVPILIGFLTMIASISTMLMILLSVIVFLLLVKVDVNIQNLEMPAVYVVSNSFKILKYVYGFIILGSIFTTAISLGTSFLQNVTKNKKSYTQIAIIMCITSVLVSKIGFSNLVSNLYPIFGYLGLIQILKLSWKW